MDWFCRITGFRETAYAPTQARLRVEDGRLMSTAGGPGFAVGELELLPLDELRTRTAAVALPGRLGFDTLEGDVRRLHAAPGNAGAVFQVASQFNLLEMAEPGLSPENGVTRYMWDRTQGPGCAIAAGAGTIWRNYLVPVRGRPGQTARHQLDALSEFGETLARGMGVDPGALWRMRNGYALPGPAQLARIEAHLAGLPADELDRLRGRLQVGVHWDVGVTEAGAAPDARVTQVFCSALPVAYCPMPTSAWTRFASLVLEAAYEATLLAALLNAARGASPRLLLTRLGGGAFGNEEAWINAAILRALRRHAHQGLEVRMVSYGAPGPAMRALQRAWESGTGAAAR